MIVHVPDKADQLHRDEHRRVIGLPVCRPPRPHAVVVRSS